MYPPAAGFHLRASQRCILIIAALEYLPRRSPEKPTALLSASVQAKPAVRQIKQTCSSKSKEASNCSNALFAAFLPG